MTTNLELHLPPKYTEKENDHLPKRNGFYTIGEPFPLNLHNKMTLVGQIGMANSVD